MSNLRYLVVSNHLIAIIMDLKDFTLWDFHVTEHNMFSSEIIYYSPVYILFDIRGSIFLVDFLPYNTRSCSNSGVFIWNENVY